MRGQRHPSAAPYPRKDPVPIIQEAGWALGPVWTGAENLAPSGFDPRTIQPEGSRYTDYATLPNTLNVPSYSEYWLNYILINRNM